MGTSHAGIMVLPGEAIVGTQASEYFKPYSDIIYEIGLTPNRADAMSHWGVARDVCAYLSHHEGKELKPVLPKTDFKVDNHSLHVQVTVENMEACPRYSGVCIAGVQIKSSPKWLQEKLKAIGLRPINNIVDITNFIQHETGQPLHAFDYDAIGGKQVVVKNLPEGTSFVTLDEKSRKLSEQDLMICDAQGGMCIAGVFGGLQSGVTDTTTNIFLESAFFNPIYIRKTSFRHGLRTDAATRFEKGIDISNTVNVLQRAALLIQELAGGSIASDVVDIYPSPQPKKRVTFSHAYLKKLSGKAYAPAAVSGILQSLGFNVAEESSEVLVVEVPYHKRDVSLPADLVEEVLRIDGLDNIEIPSRITLAPAIEEAYKEEKLKEKLSNVLTGMGFTEILTNSITNSAYYTEAESTTMVRLLNNLSNELNALRPTMLPTALEVISFNINRKNNNLKLFEFGKTYATSGVGSYTEQQHLCLYLTGQSTENKWKGKAAATDLFYIKGVAEALLKNLGITASLVTHEGTLVGSVGKEQVVQISTVPVNSAARFDIKQPVFVADFNWNVLVKLARTKVQFREISRFPVVERDLSMVVAKSLPYQQIHDGVQKLRLKQLKEVKLFDVFESEKLGHDKKSLAVNFTFQDEEKTLTDKEIDNWMHKIMTTLEKDLNAEIRKA
jgi:phenylalanyl-tRNA synthetase beta chain